MINALKIILVAVIISIVSLLLSEVYKFNIAIDQIYQDNGSVVVPSQINSYDGIYNIGGEKVVLIKGIEKKQITFGGASQLITKHWGSDLRGDFNSDGTEDVAFIVTQETGGTGLFYYVTALLNTKNGKVSIEGILLGDRIAPQTMELGANNTIVVNYADRNKGEDFSVKPSQGKTLILKVDPVTRQFGEVANNFEGEASPSVMRLDMKTWNWIKTIYNNDTSVAPVQKNKFTLTFNKDNSFSATTDCNGVGGGYMVNGNSIVFGNIISTLMYCDESQEQDFTSQLSQVNSYLFTSKGELILNMKFDSGSITFK